MFANEVAIRTLVESDSGASTKEKEAILKVLGGGWADGRKNEDRLVLTISDAAYMLGIGKQSIYKAIRKGALTKVSLGPSGRASGVSRKSVEALAEGRRM